MAELDQTARFALKIAPAEILRWLLPKLSADLAFTRWLDTETIAFPGEPRRRCDTVAELVSRSGAEPPWALVLEVEARPRPTILDRLLEYKARLLRKLRHGPHRRDRYQVAAVLLVLRGRKRRVGLHIRLPGTKLGLSLRVGVRNLGRRDAAATLARIDRRELGRSILVWVPLMNGGDSPQVVQEWVRLAQQEPDRQRRDDYAGLALVFAEWVGRLPAWKEALEGWEMWESQVIKEWQARAHEKGLLEGREEGRQKGLQEGRQKGLQEGRQEGELAAKRADLLKVLRARFQAEVPADLAQAIQEATDLSILSGWFDVSLTVPSLEAFRAAVETSAPPPRQDS